MSLLPLVTILNKLFRAESTIYSTGHSTLSVRCGLIKLKRFRIAFMTNGKSEIFRVHVFLKKLVRR